MVEESVHRSAGVGSLAKHRRAFRVQGYRLEPLEDRTLLSTILWENRGVTSGIDNDGFNTVFGANAELARRVVDAALSDWQEAITSFNHSGPFALTGTITIPDEQLNVKISAENL